MALSKISLIFSALVAVDSLLWNNLEYPIVVKKSYGAGSEEVRLINKWKEIDFPVISQQYIDVSHDIRITILGDKIFFGKRIHLWREDEKKRFPYGWYWEDTDSRLDGISLTYDEIEKILIQANKNIIKIAKCFLE